MFSNVIREMRGEGSVVRYYCTAGNGMEPFLVDEVKRKLAARDVHQIPGKVLFSSSTAIHRVCELKAAERLFLLLKQDSPVKVSTHSSPAKTASLLQSRLVGDGGQWLGAVMTWSRLQGELAASRNAVKASTTQGGVGTGRGCEKQSDEGERRLQESRKRSQEFTAEGGDEKRLRGREQDPRLSLEREKEDAVRESKKAVCAAYSKKEPQRNVDEPSEDASLEKVCEQSDGKQSEPPARMEGRPKGPEDGDLCLSE